MNVNFSYFNNEQYVFEFRTDKLHVLILKWERQVQQIKYFLRFKIEPLNNRIQKS